MELIGLLAIGIVIGYVRLFFGGIAASSAVPSITPLVKMLYVLRMVDASAFRSTGICIGIRK